MFKLNCRAFALGALALAALPAFSSVVMTASSLSTNGESLSFKADLAISDDILTVQLFNASSSASSAPDRLLSSFYFDIINGSHARPELTYISAVGDVWLAAMNSPDTLKTANANLMAVVANDNTWQYRAMDAAMNPFHGFGIGTVGNSALANNFKGNVVGAIDYSIYTGDITTQNLNNRLLVKDKATFTFAGVRGFTEADIARTSVFGLGTAPDSLLATTAPASPPPPPPVDIPTPGTALAGLVGLGLLGIRHYIRRRHSDAAW